MDPFILILKLAGFVTGFSKFSVGGMGLLILPIVMLAVPGPEALAVIVPMYVVTDILAVYFYRGAVAWKLVWRILPLSFVGVGVGAWLLSDINRELFELLLGVIIFLVVLAGFWFDRQPAQFMKMPSVAYVFGIFGGFISLVANAAGPFISLFLVEQKLSKASYVSTRAVLFLIINLMKVPALLAIGLLNQQTFVDSFYCLPGLLVGAALGNWFLDKINVSQFKWVIRAIALVAGAKLIFF